MVQTSPGVDRVASILSLMSTRPGQPFAVSDLIKALKISKTTCHTLVASLVRVGYLYRTHDGHYILGPALAAIGQIALRHASPLLVAQPEMRALSDRFDCVCSAYFRERDHLIVRERFVSTSDARWLSPLGTSVRIRPPFGAIFYAWSSEQDVQRWLETSSSGLTADERSNLAEGMAFARKNLFAFTVRSDSAYALPADEGTGLISAGINLEALVDYSVSSVFAPVFDAGRNVVFTISLGGWAAPVRGATIEAIGESLRQACNRITTFIGGSIPEI